MPTGDLVAETFTSRVMSRCRISGCTGFCHADIVPGCPKWGVVLLPLLGSAQRSQGPVACHRYSTVTGSGIQHIFQCLCCCMHAFYVIASSAAVMYVILLQTSMTSCGKATVSWQRSCEQSKARLLGRALSVHIEQLAAFAKNLSDAAGMYQQLCACKEVVAEPSNVSGEVFDEAIKGYR